MSWGNLNNCQFGFDVARKYEFNAYVLGRSSTSGFLYEYNQDGAVGSYTGVFGTSFAIRTGPKSNPSAPKSHDVYAGRHLSSTGYNGRYSVNGTVSTVWQDSQSVGSSPGDIFVSVNKFGESLYCDGNTIYATDADGVRMWTDTSSISGTAASSGVDTFPDGDWCLTTGLVGSTSDAKIYSVSRSDGTLTLIKQLSGLEGLTVRCVKVLRTGEIIVVTGRYHYNFVTGSDETGPGTGDPKVTSYNQDGSENWSYTPTEGTSDTLRPFARECITTTPSGSVYLAMAKSSFVIDPDLQAEGLAIFETPPYWTSVATNVCKLYKINGDTGDLIWSRFYDDVSDSQWFYNVDGTDYAVDEDNAKTLNAVCANDSVVFLAFTGSQQKVGGFYQTGAIVRVSPSDGSIIEQHSWGTTLRPYSLDISPGGRYEFG